MKARAEYHITIVENNDSVSESFSYSRKQALKLTNAAEKVRNCKCWRITYVKQPNFIKNEQSSTK